jgi:hypothetical protein
MLDCWERFIKYAIEMGSGAIKIGSAIQELIKGATQRAKNLQYGTPTS